MGKLAAIRGANDFVYEQAERAWTLEKTFREIALRYGYEEIRTPIFEYTELFARGIGEETDVVSKEMFTFEDRGGRSLTLRPEGTAPVVRAYVEHNLFQGRGINKIFYMGPMFRAERPQKGRYREFHQFGIEVIGTESPYADAEVILLNLDFFKTLGVKRPRLIVNTVGHPGCRANYERTLRETFKDDRSNLCDACRTRYEKNVLRMLDCKVPSCQPILSKAPAFYDAVCDECRAHFDAVCAALTDAGVEYSVNPRLVRGFDYYTRTAFEIQDASLGAQNALAGGGRYDGLVGVFNNGKDVPGVGSALGVERLMIALDDALSGDRALDVFLVTFSETKDQTLQTLQALRKEGLSADADFNAPSVKSQFKSANKRNAKVALIAGPEEVSKGTFIARDMRTGKESAIAIADCASAIRRALANEQ